MVFQKQNYFQRRTRPRGPRTNDKIRAHEVQVINSEGKNLGESSQIPYMEQPWEIEAFSKQDVLADMFLIPHLTKFKREELKKLNDAENQLKKVLPMTALKQKENQ